MTATELAAATGVSAPTARRDLAALAAAGVPVYPQPGRHGGWQLVGGARTNLSGLTSDEAEALFLLLGSGLAAHPEAAGGIAKLLSALPSTFRDAATTAASAVARDPAPWGGPPSTRPALLGVLERAVARHQQLALDYRDRTGHRSRPVVEPHRLVEKGRLWYLLAGTASGERVHRVDRISAAEPTGVRFERPDEQVIEDAWLRSLEAGEAARSRASATILAPAALLLVLRDRFGSHLTVLEDADPVLLQITAQMDRALAEQLAGWGDHVEVVGPDSVRAELARLGAGLVARYGLSAAKR